MDISPEEVRFEAYKANAEGKADAYVRVLRLFTLNSFTAILRQSNSVWTHFTCSNSEPIKPGEF